MSDTKSTSSKSAAAKSAGDSGEAEVQATVDKVEERGFLGNRVDETPREHYTISGVLAGKPTPETDIEADETGATFTTKGR